MALRTTGSAMTPVVTAAEMRAIESAALARGVSALDLMEAAGAAAAQAIRAFAGQAPTLVLCGPGNNGGDGYVIARLLREIGWPVRVAALAAPTTDTAKAVAARWKGPIERIDDNTQTAPILIDALFGIGLTRPIGDPTLLAVHRLGQAALALVAIDLPSGVATDDGALVSMPVRADMTISFGALKPSHLLHPAARFAGRLVVAEIGLAPLAPDLFALGPPSLPPVQPDAHKFARGHALVVGGPLCGAGASRLAARAALRVGAGYVTLLSDPGALSTNAAQLTDIVLRVADTGDTVAEAFAEPRASALAIGPALGSGRDKILAALRVGKPVVLDADVFTLFAGDPETLFTAIQSEAILTPHEGEFVRLFGDAAGSKVERARAAARQAGAVVVMKGPDTVIAAPDGRAAINAHAAPWLATAGAGDVLTGMIVGLLAQGLPAFKAACAAVWLHGDAGRRGGLGLTADDLPELLPQVLQDLM